MERTKSPLTVARERLDLTQSDIAGRCGVTQATVSNWETGLTVPHPSLWRTIAEAYDVSMKRLFECFGAEAS